MGASGLSAAAVLHVYWLIGGRRASTNVIPTTDGQPNLRPGPLATAAVAAALLAAARLYTGASLERRPRWLFRTGTTRAAAILAMRAVGDGRQLGFTKTTRHTPFAHLDTTVLSPICAALAIAGFVAALSP